MTKPVFLLLCAFFSAGATFSQISFTGNNTATTTPVNAPAIVIDNALSITSGVSFDGAKVSVSTNFNSGDILSYSGALPVGVTASYNNTTGVLTFTGTATAAAYEALLKTVTFQTSSAIATQRIILFNLGADFAFAGNGHLYEFVAGSFSWTASKAAAATRSKFGMTGYLTTITSLDENTFITQKLGANGWIGASDDDNEINAGVTYASQAAAEGKWYWVTGPEAGTQFSNNNGTPTQLTFMNWNSGEPNNSGTNEHYGQIFASVSTGKWNDLPNTSMLGYVVEYGGVSGDPVVDIIHTRNIQLIATSLQASATNNGYALHAPATVIDNALLVYSAANIINAKATVSSGFKSGDVLDYNVASLPANVTGSYNSTTGVLSFTGTASPAAWQNLLRTVTFASISNIIGNRSVSFSVGNLIAGSNGHFYENITATANWGNAKTGAAGRTYLGLQGYLATITSQVENDFIQQKLSANAWIGISDQWDYINPVAGTSYTSPNSSEGRWYWITGPEAGQQITTANVPNASSLPPVFGTAYNNWNLGEPNNSPNENYGQIYSIGANPGKWNDLSGGELLPYVVEYGGLGTDPLLQLSANRTVVITTILPVGGWQFDVVKRNTSAVINWSTESETNTHRFDVLHSIDGRMFEKLSSVPAAQNSNTRKNYTASHSTPESEIHYYKIQLVDRDGRSTYSNIKQISFDNTNAAIVPNPVHNTFTISNPFGRAAILFVKNVAGLVVLKQNIGAHTSSVQAGHLPSGFYFAEVACGQQTSAIIKIIKK